MAGRGSAHEGVEDKSFFLPFSLEAGGADGTGTFPKVKELDNAFFLL